MKVIVKQTNDGWLVIEPDGKRREICNLYFGQMIYHYKGQYFYSKDIPNDYFAKAEFLRSKGWDTGYHYEDWYKLENGWTEYGGIKTDDAIKECKKHD